MKRRSSLTDRASDDAVADGSSSEDSTGTVTVLHVCRLKLIKELDPISKELLTPLLEGR